MLVSGYSFFIMEVEISWISLNVNLKLVFRPRLAYVLVCLCSTEFVSVAIF